MPTKALLSRPWPRTSATRVISRWQSEPTLWLRRAIPPTPPLPRSTPRCWSRRARPARHARFASCRKPRTSRNRRCRRIRRHRLFFLLSPGHSHVRQDIGLAELPWPAPTGNAPYNRGGSMKAPVGVSPVWAWGVAMAIQIFDVTTSREVSLLRGYEDRVYSVIFSPDGRTLAAGCED